MSAIENLRKFVIGRMDKSAADDGTIPATTGERSAENAADVEAQTPGQNAASAPAQSDNPTVGGTSGTPANDGTGAGMTGDRASEDVKTTADDPGTSHPSKSATLRTTAEIKQAGLSVLAALSAAKPARQPVKSAASEHARGEAAADAAISALGLDKRAASETLADIMKSAAYDAEEVVSFLSGFAKAANEGLPPEAMPPEAMPPEAMPPEAMPQDGGQEIAPEELMGLLEQAGVTPEELLVELVESGEIPVEVAEQIVQEAEAAAASGGAPGEVPAEAAPAEAAPAEAAPAEAAPAELVSPPVDKAAAAREREKRAALARGLRIALKAFDK